MTAPPLRIGVIGYGYWGPSLVRNFAAGPVHPGGGDRGGVRGLAAGGGGDRAAHPVRQQYRMRPWPIGELPENELGRMIGNVRELERTLTAPLTGRACVYYMLVVWESGWRGWRDLFIERKGVAFAIDDPSGRAIIEPANASVALAFDHQEELRALDRATSEQAAVLARCGHGLGGRSWPLRLSEAVISADERVTVVGAGSRDPDRASRAETDYRGPLPKLLNVASSGSAPLSISSHRAR